ncbi:hypothetical protein BX666DRAFT_1337908 [Dichotomocladium elegans]|nr:hypothetical protein BX666DRAFT_1337908 [Dichotomocladium elegans]
MGKSPFYSHIDRAPLIIFGVVNVIFGCISIVSFLLIARPNYYTVRITVYVIAAGAAAVLIDMLVNFILFAANQDVFQTWCVDYSKMVVQTTLSQEGNPFTIDNDNDYYNCNRLFANQVKWSLLSVIAMFIVYVHWVLVISAFAGTPFFLIPPQGAQLDPEMAAMAASVAPQPPLPPPPPPSGAGILHNLPSSKRSSSIRPLRKKTDESILAMLGLRINDSGRIIHISNESSLPYYYDHRRDSAASDTSLLK